jgi:hypothetical protein
MLANSIAVAQSAAAYPIGYASLVVTSLILCYKQHFNNPLLLTVAPLHTVYLKRPRLLFPFHPKSVVN